VEFYLLRFLVQGVRKNISFNGNLSRNLTKNSIKEGNFSGHPAVDAFLCYGTR